MMWPRVELRRILRLEYGDPLADGVRNPGPVPVYGSNGQVGTHDRHNTGAPCLIIGRKGSHGKIHYSIEPAFAIDTTYFVDDRCTHAYLRWLFYAIQTLGLDQVTSDVGVPGLNRDDAYRERVPLPSRAEQVAVADFLDAETSHIDKVVGTRRRMIELVTERFRLYCLNQTTSAPAIALRRVAISIRTGRTPDTARVDYYGGGSIDWYSPGDFADVLDLESPQRFVSDVAKDDGAIDVFPANSTLVVGIGATAGRVAHLDHAAASNQQITCIHTNERMFNRFLSWQLWARSDELRGTAPYTTLPIITNEFLANLRVSVPEVQTQTLIARELDDMASRLSALRRLLSVEIALLRERRASLITAAVNGQFRIPGVAA